MKTSHQFAQELLDGPDLPVFTRCIGRTYVTPTQVQRPLGPPMGEDIQCIVIVPLAVFSSSEPTE